MQWNFFSEILGFVENPSSVNPEILVQIFQLVAEKLHFVCSDIFYWAFMYVH